MEADAAAGSVQLGYASPDGEEGYPGAVDFTVTFRLDGPRLVCEMAGHPDRPTPIASPTTATTTSAAAAR